VRSLPESSRQAAIGAAAAARVQPLQAVGQGAVSLVAGARDDRRQAAVGQQVVGGASHAVRVRPRLVLRRQRGWILACLLKRQDLAACTALHADAAGTIWVSAISARAQRRTESPNVRHSERVSMAWDSSTNPHSWAVKNPGRHTNLPPREPMSSRRHTCGPAAVCSTAVSMASTTATPCR